MPNAALTGSPTLTGIEPQDVMDATSSALAKPKRPTARRRALTGARKGGNLDPGRRHPSLRSSTTSEQAFVLIALRCLDCMVLHESATLRGDAAALHRIRIAITCLRTVVSFFSPLVDGQEWRRLKHELKWLNASLSAARDLDVVVDRMRKREELGSSAPDLVVRQSASHARVARAIRSSRYRRLMENGIAWIQHGPWRHAPESAPARAIPISAYASRRLKRWRRRIIRKRDELATMDAKTRHRLRIRTKRARYATEWFGEFLPNGSSQGHRAMVKQLRLAQNSLGDLNDAERAKALVEGPVREARAQLSDAKQNKRLLRAAIAAFETLAQLDKAN